MLEQESNSNLRVEKDINVEEIKKHLFRIANGLKAEGEKVKARLVQDEWYSSMTVMIGGKVLCINFMN